MHDCTVATCIVYLFHNNRGVDAKSPPSSVSLRALMAEEEEQVRTKLVTMETHTAVTHRHGEVKPASIRRYGVLIMSVSMCLHVRH